MWFLIGFLVGATVRVEPASSAVVAASPDVPIWVQVLIALAAICMAVPLGFAMWRSMFSGVYEQMAEARRNYDGARAAANRELLAQKEARR